MCAQVLECSWDELWSKVRQAQDLDHIIAAHDVFLDTIISRCLLDNNSRVTHKHTRFLCSVSHSSVSLFCIPLMKLCYCISSLF